MGSTKTWKMGSEHTTLGSEQARNPLSQRQLGCEPGQRRAIEDHVAGPAPVREQPLVRGVDVRQRVGHRQRARAAAVPAVVVAQDADLQLPRDFPAPSRDLMTSHARLYRRHRHSLPLQQQAACRPSTEGTVVVS